MGEGTSEIRHLRERVIQHDDMLRAIGERILLLDEMVQRLEALLPGGTAGTARQETPGAKAVAPVTAAPATPTTTAARTSSAVRRR